MLRAMVLCLTFSLACGDDAATDAGTDAGPDATFDAGQDSGPRTCMSDEVCDDGIPCTRDLCMAGFCRNRDDSAMCDDNIFCNGVEVCDREAGGCAPGQFQSCDDRDVCTIDRCDEESKTCQHSVRDFDEDGDADWNCAGGTDCDDRDPLRSTSVAEICTDGIDNDCDEETDEADCGRPMHDTCDDALDVSGGGVFEVRSEGAAPDHPLTCAPPGRGDVVLSFTLDVAQDLAVRAAGSSLTFLGLRSTCAASDSEFECGSGFPGQVRARALEAGEYFVVVAGGGSELVVEVVFSEPSEAPTNQSCESPIDVSAGGSFVGSLVDVSDALETGCGEAGWIDLSYVFTLEEEQDVLVSALSREGGAMAVEVQDTCGGEARRCMRGNPGGGRLHRVPAGTYFIVVESGPALEADFTLSVEFEEPSDPPSGDTCDEPIELSAAAPVMGNLRGLQDDLSPTCGSFYPDAVHRFRVDERSDVTLVADGGGAFAYLSLRSECGEVDTQLRCSSGNPGRVLARDLPPGEYFAIVESPSPLDYELTLSFAPPTPVTDVSGNETCESAFNVPAEGGLFRGSTRDMVSDYSTRLCGSAAASPDVAFRLELTERRRVVVTSAGSDFDTVIHRHGPICTNRSELACDDDSGDGAAGRLEELLEAGVHHYVVDGWGDSNVGEYFFQVTTGAP